MCSILLYQKFEDEMDKYDPFNNLAVHYLLKRRNAI